MIEPTLVRKIEWLLRPDDGPPMSEEAKRLLRDIMEDARQKGIEADIRSGWYGVPEICKRWQVGAAKVTVIRKRLGKGRKA